MFVEANKAYFEKNGFLVLNECLKTRELKYYDKIYDVSKYLQLIKKALNHLNT